MGIACRRAGWCWRRWSCLVLPTSSCRRSTSSRRTAWAAPTALLLREVLRQPPDRLTLFAVEASLARRGIALGFLSAPAFAESVAPLPRGQRDAAAAARRQRAGGGPALSLRGLAGAVPAVARSPDPAAAGDRGGGRCLAIAAGRPGRRLPGRHLAGGGLNVGPYRLVQTVIEQTRFDAYCFRTPTNWSSDDRLERFARRRGANGGRADRLPGAALR